MARGALSRAPKKVLDSAHVGEYGTDMPNTNFTVKRTEAVIRPRPFAIRGDSGFVTHLGSSGGGSMYKALAFATYDEAVAHAGAHSKLAAIYNLGNYCDVLAWVKRT